MSAALQAREPDAKYLVKRQSPLAQHFDQLAKVPRGVAQLRELILTLAVQGKLVPQDMSDEPAIDLLKSIRAEKLQLVAAGDIQRDRAVSSLENKALPFELPTGWQWIQLGALLPFRIGRTPPSKDPQFWGSAGHAWVSIGDMTHLGEIHDTSRKITDKGAAMFGHRPLPAGTLIMSFKLTIGKIAVLRVPAYHNEAIISFQQLNGLNTDFFKYILPIVASSGSSKNALMGQTLNADSLSNLLIALLPLAEQSRIVARVDKLMQLCDALEANGRLEAAQHSQLVATLLNTLTDSASPEALTDLWQRIAAHFDILLDRPEAVDALEQTILQLAVRGMLVPQDPDDEPASMLLGKIRDEKNRLIADGTIRRDRPLPAIAEDEVPFELPTGWEWVRLNELLRKIGAGSTPLGGKEVYTQSGVKFLRSQNVWDDGLRLSNVAFISAVTHMKMNGTVVRSNDLLFNITGASIGRCAVVPADFDEANVSQHVVIVRPVMSFLAAFLHKVLVSRHVQQAVMEVQVGVSREGLSIAKLGQFLIPIAPLAEQARIVARVEELRRLCADIRNRFAAIQATQAHLAEALIDQAT